jgi:iron complex transport system ATP-binding protein
VSKAPNALDIRDVTVVRGGRTLLSRLSFAVPGGATCAVVGPNGSGKSTLLRVIEGFEFPTSGEARVLGEKLGETNLAELRRRVRLVGSAGALDFEGEMTLERVAATGAEGFMYAHQETTPELLALVRAKLRQVGLAGREGVRWSHASAGERTRTLLARSRMPTGGASSARDASARAAAAQLLLLDEPTANLDPAAREGTVKFFGRPPRGVAQLIVTHHVEELPEITTLALVLREGKGVAFGPAAKVLTSANLTRAFGVRMTVSRRLGRFSARVG